MRAVLLALALAFAFPAAAQPAKVPVWMTGQALLALLTFPSSVKGGLDMSDAQFLDAERARLYIEGVHDNSAGKAWCYNTVNPPGPDAVHDAVVMGLRSMAPAQLKRNAADLIVEIWQNRWPCRGREGAR